ncbi:hypothetical protein ACP275_13G006200 [Erythranthe tilingii]
MDSTEPSSLSQSSLLTIDEFEGLEAIEFDPNTIRELLYEPLEGVVHDGDETLMEFAESKIPDLLFDSDWCLDDIDNTQNFDWLDLVEEESPLCNDMYGGICMEDMNQVFEIQDYSLSHTPIVYDDIGYLGLWQEN